jgi:hypothetical protein
VVLAGGAVHSPQEEALSVRDFYLHDGRRLGYVQSLELDAGTIRILPVRRFNWR